MTTGKPGRAALSPHVLQQQAKNQQYRKILVGHEIDKFPELFDELVKKVGLTSWYMRPVPEGESTTYWIANKHLETREEHHWWKEHQNDDIYVQGRRTLVKAAFVHLTSQKKVVIALRYGLLDGIWYETVTESRVGEKMQFNQDYAVTLLRIALNSLRRECKILAGNISQYDQSAALASSTPLELLDLSNKAYHCLQKRRIRTVEELERLEASWLMAIRGTGVKLLLEICVSLKQHGRSLPVGAENYIDINDL